MQKTDWRYLPAYFLYCRSRYCRAYSQYSQNQMYVGQLFVAAWAVNEAVRASAAAPNINDFFHVKILLFMFTRCIIHIKQRNRSFLSATFITKILHDYYKKQL